MVKQNTVAFQVNIAYHMPLFVIHYIKRTHIHTDCIIISHSLLFHTYQQQNSQLQPLVIIFLHCIVSHSEESISHYVSRNSRIVYLIISMHSSCNLFLNGYKQFLRRLSFTWKKLDYVDLYSSLLFHSQYGNLETYQLSCWVANQQNTSKCEPLHHCESLQCPSASSPILFLCSVR